MDEASQSDIREVPALLRGKKILVVGDDKLVNPTAAFIENGKIDRLEHGFLKGSPSRHFCSREPRFWWTKPILRIDGSGCSLVGIVMSGWRPFGNDC
jgi:superfamily I DNA and/or RNA helicase